MRKKRWRKIIFAFLNWTLCLQRLQSVMYNFVSLSVRMSSWEFASNSSTSVWWDLSCVIITILICIRKWNHFSLQEWNPHFSHFWFSSASLTLIGCHPVKNSILQNVNGGWSWIVYLCDCWNGMSFCWLSLSSSSSLFDLFLLSLHLICMNCCLSMSYEAIRLGTTLQISLSLSS